MEGEEGLERAVMSAADAGPTGGADPLAQRPPEWQR